MSEAPEPAERVAKLLARILDPLDDAVLGEGVDDKTGPRVLDRLVMGAVDREVGGAGDAVQQGAGDHPDGVPGFVPRVRLSVRHAARDLVGDVLDQGAAEHDVQ